MFMKYTYIHKYVLAKHIYICIYTYMVDIYQYLYGECIHVLIALQCMLTVLHRTGSVKPWPTHGWLICLLATSPPKTAKNTNKSHGQISDQSRFFSFY